MQTVYGLLSVIFAVSIIALPSPPQTQIKPLMINPGASWDLTTTQWQHYKELMKGPSGIWYKQLNPAEILGINAETDEERNQFARVVVKQRHDRIEKELAFERATHLAWQQLYPRLKPIALFDTQDYGPRRMNKVALRPGDHLLLFTRIDDPVNFAVVPLLLGLIEMYKGVILDIYFSGGPGSSEIDAWAKRMRLSLRLVNLGEVTLNKERKVPISSAVVIIKHGTAFYKFDWERLADIK